MQTHPHLEVELLEDPGDPPVQQVLRDVEIVRDDRDALGRARAVLPVDDERAHRLAALHAVARPAPRGEGGGIDAVVADERRGVALAGGVARVLSGRVSDLRGRVDDCHAGGHRRRGDRSGENEGCEQNRACECDEARRQRVHPEHEVPFPEPSYAARAPQVKCGLFAEGT
jgi:hypothetical protein